MHKDKMATEDVIELGSSDDDTEPAPKKQKPMPNAMVHIPSKLPDIIIKPKPKPKPNKSPNNTLPLKSPIIINKSNLMINPFRKIVKSSATTVRVPIQNKMIRNDVKNVQPGKNMTAINPLTLVQKLNKTQVAMKKVPQFKTLRKPIEIQGTKVLNNLPPGITIKPVHKPDITKKPVQRAGASGVLKRGRVFGPKRKPPGEILTVEIEDEDTPESATSSPQWYLRPEDQKEESVKQNKEEANMEIDIVVPSMEEMNNKEPEKTNYVEITIEDSPLKPHINSNHPDIGKELTITIEDSPIKPKAKTAEDIDSDSATNEEVGDKNSKKKLDYPKVSQNSNENQVVEIEIDLCEPNSFAETEKNSKPSSPIHKPIEETKKSPKQKPDTEKVNHSKQEAITDVEQAKEIIKEDGEFHPTYEKFIQMCFQLEDTEDMKKIVDKKIKAYYRQCPKDYVESEEFIDMVSSKINSMKASPEKMYLYIKDIVDELNLQRKMAKTNSVVSEKVDTGKESMDVMYVESEYDSKKRRQIRKLEKTIKKLHRAIQKLEEQEVDFDDDEDSVYLLTERYKERMVRVHAKFCQLTNTKMPSEPRIHIEARPGRPTGPAKKLEKWINRKVPIGTPLPFPDFHDVLRCVRDANEEDKLGWNDVDIMEEARDLFTRCGKKLQRRRQENEWRIAASRISAEVDPAENSLDLKKKLEENKTVAAKREAELLNKYVDRQNLLKLEAVEIGDKEAEESPVESEEEEDTEVNDSMEDKQKRKQRLKRLLQEKSKKEEDKENVVLKNSEEKETSNEPKEEKSKDIEQEIGKEIKEKSNNDVVESIPNETESTEGKHNDKDDNVDKDDDNDNDKDNCANIKENQNDEIKSNKVESDVDELHLLQKLHSESEANSSTLESSDSDTPIAISDTLESDSEQDIGIKCDIISIENSSYSESEIDAPSKDNDTNSLNIQNVEDLVTANFEVEYFSTGIEETHTETTAKETTKEIEENILLASSDEEVKDKAGSIEIEDTCINLGDDNISISETTIDGGTIEEGNVSNDENAIQENNNAIITVADSANGKENADIDMLEENIEDFDNTCENIIQLCSRMEEGTNENNSPKDIVEIRSASDVNSIESADLQTDNENKDNSCEHSESMDITESNCNEKSELMKGEPDNTTQNEVHSLQKETNDQSTTTEIVT